MLANVTSKWWEAGRGDVITPPRKAPASSKHTHPCLPSPPVQFLYGAGQLFTNAFWWQLGMQDLLSSQPLPTETWNASVGLSLVLWVIFSCIVVTSFSYFCPLLQVQYSDAQSGKDFVTYLTLSPVQMTFHGTGSTLQASHDQVRVCLRTCYIVAINISPVNLGRFGESEWIKTLFYA